MSIEPQTGPNPYTAYIAVALCGAFASVAIAWLVLSRFTQVSDGGMFAIALMVLAPTAMALGVALFVYKTAGGGRTAGGPGA